jgi:hypothetical protein
MPGHTTLWGPEHFIKALRQIGGAFSQAGVTLSANECEGAARMMWKLWTAADPQGAKEAKPRLFSKGETEDDGK